MTDENTDADVESGTDPDTQTDTDPDTDRDIPDTDVDDTAVIEDSSAPLTNNKRLRTLVFRVLPALVVLLGAGAGLLRWQDSSHRTIDNARTESVAAAREATMAILSYKADSVEQDLGSARDRLTGSFLNSFTDLINKVVIPGAREKKISVAAKVSAAASVSATTKHAVALVFVDQTVVIGGGAPSGSASSVRVTLDKVDDRWLVSGFDPV
jgi:Mce-associated membrane protein